MASLPFIPLASSAIILFLYSFLWFPPATLSATNSTQFACENCTDYEANVKYLRCKVGCNDGFYKVPMGTVRDCLTEKQKDSLTEPQNETNSRKKRQEQSTIPTTTASTTPVITWLCRNCSLQSCNKCRDDVQEPMCESCFEGYRLDNISHTCVGSEEGLPAEAAAGITIAVLCIVGVAIATVVFVTRRARQSGDISSGHAEKLQKMPSSDKCYGRSSITDTNVIEELGIAPEPPSNNYVGMEKSYEHLNKMDAEDQFYLPLQNEQDGVYQNTAQNTDSVYMNTKLTKPADLHSRSQFHGKTQLTPAAGSRSNGLPVAKSQDSVEVYEEVNASGHLEQDIYENNDSAALVRKDTEGVEDIYVNEGQEEDVYQNT